MKTWLVCSVLLCLASLSTAGEGAPTLTFDDRVRAQESILRVYHGHAIGRSRSFGESVPREVIERQVRQYLDQSNALERIWKNPVTAVMLRAEIERIVRGTQSPGRLMELFRALGNDPVVIQECLARPILVDRLTRNFYESGPLSRVSGNAVPWDVWWATARQPLAGRGVETVADAHVPAIDRFSSTAGSPPCVPDGTWDNGSLDDFPDGRTSPAVVWTGSKVVVWGGTDGNRGSSNGWLYDPATDTWSQASNAGAPSPRGVATAVWTGTRMLVWGGYTGVNALGTGAAYDPVADTWTPIAILGAPSPRWRHTAVWTGSRMLVWGGTADESYFGNGASYDPVSNTWTPIASLDAPSARERHSAVWTGSRMVVWGGQDGNGVLATGRRYDPVANAWSSVSAVGAPAARSSHSAVWTGGRMIVWGGVESLNGYSNSGARYDPVTDVWAATATAGAPPGRRSHNAVWSGSQMLIWDGDVAFGSSATGGRYDPVANVWVPISAVGAPPPVLNGGAVWTGDRMITWGGQDPQTGALPQSGGRYSPASDSWTRTVSRSGPVGRDETAGVWTGNVMVVWGGHANGEAFGSNTGERYDPTTDAWSPTSTIGAPLGRNNHAVVWTGSEMIVWGGWNLGVLNSGGRYNPTLDTWAPTSLVGAPEGRSFTTAVWTGTRMVIWGGAVESDGGTNTGGRYDPVTDTWSATSLVGAPSLRGFHTGQWTGSRMLIWGGSYAEYLDTGGIYDPAADSWTAMGSHGAPSGRELPVSVWTGSRMVVWGGFDGGAPVGTGGSFDPDRNRWSSVSTTGAPSPRWLHAGVWTGQELAVWGGASDDNGEDFLGDGARYDPSSDTWVPMESLGAPTPRTRPVAVWTGSRVIVWGGRDVKSSGGRYALGDDLDLDGDGFSSCQGDCNDSNSGRHPGAVEVCNGIDEDCDGAADEDFDVDVDGFTTCGGDCDDGSASVRSTPGEARQLTFVDRGTLAWTAPAAPGGTAPVYDSLRATSASGFMTAVCIESGDGSDTTATDNVDPAPGATLYFLVRAANACPAGTGTLGSNSEGNDRPGRTCP